MQAVHRVAKNTGILYIRMAVTVFISLYATRLILAALGVADFGLFNVVGGVIAMLGFLNSSMAAATQRFMSFAQGAGDLEKVKRIFNMSTVLHAGIAVLMVIVLEIAGYFFLNGILNIAPDRLVVAKIIYHFMVASTFFTVLSVPYEAVITSHENMMFYAILGVLESIFKLAIALYLAHSAYDHLIAYGFLMAALSIFLLLLQRIYCHRYYSECVLNFRKYYEKSLLKEISSFAGWSLLGSATSMGAFYGQTLVINVFFGTIVNAAQGIAAQISGQLGVFALTLSKALNPVIGKSEGAGNRERTIRATLLGTKISFFLLGILYVPFIIEMPYILHLWLKNVPEYTVIFCKLLLFRNLIEQLFIPLSAAINAVGNIKEFQKISAVLNLTPIAAAFIFFSMGLPAYSIYIAFILFSVLRFFNVIHFAIVKCSLSSSVFYKEIVSKSVLVFILSIIIGYLPNILMNESLVRLFIVIAIGGLSYLIFMWFIGLEEDERNMISNMKKILVSKINSIIKK